MKIYIIKINYVNCVLNLIPAGVVVFLNISVCVIICFVLIPAGDKIY